MAAVRAFTGGDGLDAAALGTVGIDLDAVRDSVEAAFGPGALDAPRGTRAHEGPHPLHAAGEEGAGAVPAGGPRAEEQEHRRRAHRARAAPRGRGAGHEGRSTTAGIDAGTLREEIRTALAS